MPAHRTLMLVSSTVDTSLRQQVAAGSRPAPEFLRLERDHGVRLLDWSQLPHPRHRRSLLQSIAHVRAALDRLDAHDAVLSDGEHVGIPLALAMRALRRDVPQLMVGHHLTTRAKPQLLRLLGDHGQHRILVHSRHQQAIAERDLGIPPSRLEFLPYCADEAFWRPQTASEDPLIVSAGLEHRDYRTLALACGDLSERVFVAAGSLHSPRAHCTLPSELPGNFCTGFLEHRALRDLYARAKVVVVPLLPSDFQGGVTTLLEGMAMGKAVVVSATDGLGDIVRDGETGVLVPPGDAGELRAAVTRLLADPGERGRLGANARAAVETEFALDLYTARLAAHLADLHRLSVAAA
jgi:glycosyltransferase involved in cell wall biosynthesis